MHSLASRLLGDTKVVKNTIFLSLGNALAKGFAFVLTVVMARKLGPEHFGLFFTATAWSAIVFQLSTLGLDILLKRDLPRDLNQTAKFLGNALTLRLLSALILLPLLLMVSVWVVDSPLATVVFALLALFFVSDSMNALVMAVFEAHERMEYEAAIVVSKGFVTLVLGALALYSGRGVVAVAIVYFVVGVAALVASLVIVSGKIAEVKLKLNPGLWKSMISTSYVWAVMTLFLMLNLKADSALLSIFRTVDEVGLYNSAHQITSGITMLPAAVTFAFFPGLTRDFVHSIGGVKSGFKRLLAVNLMLGLAVTTPLILFAGTIMRFLYSDTYVQAALSLRILGFALLLFFISSACGTALNAMNKERALLWVVTAAFAVNILLNLLLIPAYGYNGASVAKVCSEATLAFLALLIVTRNIGIRATCYRVLGLDVIPDRDHQNTRPWQ